MVFLDCWRMRPLASETVEAMANTVQGLESFVNSHVKVLSSEAILGEMTDGWIDDDNEDLIGYPDGSYFQFYIVKN